MNSVQMHLALTHVPVILSFVGLIMLIVAFFRKNTILTKTSYILLMVVGVTTLPVFYSGEGAEEAIENLPGVSEVIIERHEEVAKLSMISIAATGLLACTALFSFRWVVAIRVFKALVLLLAFASGGLMAQTAHLGGQIRHTEIRSGIALKETGSEDVLKENQQNEKDDD